MNIRPARVETDLPGVVRVLNLCEPDHPSTEAGVRANFENQAPGRIVLRLVAVDETEKVLAYGMAIHAAEAPAHHFYTWLGVDPAHRQRGIGSALWEQALGFLQEHAAARLGSESADSDPASLAFAERRGFKIERQHFYSCLDLSSFDETPYLPLIAALETRGIRFCSLADFPDTPATRQKFYELNLAVVRDIPGEDWDFEQYPAFFEQQILGSPRFRREGQLLAVDGETMVGFAAVSLYPEDCSAYNATTGVIRTHRGQKIGLVLKVLSARYARQHGARKLDTDNNSLNAPILSINRQMGYQPQPGTYHLVQWLNS